jgi:hypothetical protein
MAIARAIADECAFGAVIKFGCRVIAHSSKTDMIVHPSQSNMIAFTVMGKGDRQPKPYACDRFLSIQLAQISL